MSKHTIGDIDLSKHTIEQGASLWQAAVASATAGVVGANEHLQQDSALAEELSTGEAAHKTLLF